MYKIKLNLLIFVIGVLIGNSLVFAGKYGDGDRGNSTPPRGNVEKVGSAFVYNEIVEGFQSGDLLYGIQNFRRETLNQLKNSYPSRAWTVDIFNKLIWSKLVEGELFKSVLDRKETLNQWLAKNELCLDNNSEDQDEQRLCQNDEEKARFAAYYEYLVKKIESEATSMGFAVDTQFYRFACIQAISFNHQNHRKIHFILDGLELDQVYTNGSKNFDSFTSHELRSIVREANDPTSDVAVSVEFYQTGKQISDDEKHRLLAYLGGKMGSHPVVGKRPRSPMIEAPQVTHDRDAPALSFGL